MRRFYFLFTAVMGAAFVSGLAWAMCAILVSRDPAQVVAGVGLLSVAAVSGTGAFLLYLVRPGIAPSLDGLNGLNGLPSVGLTGLNGLTGLPPVGLTGLTGLPSVGLNGLTGLTGLTGLNFNGLDRPMGQLGLGRIIQVRAHEETPLLTCELDGEYESIVLATGDDTPPKVVFVEWGP